MYVTVKESYAINNRAVIRMEWRGGHNRKGIKQDSKSVNYDGHHLDKNQGCLSHAAGYSLFYYKCSMGRACTYLCIPNTVAHKLSTNDGPSFMSGRATAQTTPRYHTKVGTGIHEQPYWALATCYNSAAQRCFCLF